MPGVFAKALGRLNSTPLEAVADTLAFESIDAAILAQRLELAKHGAERGKLNEPSGSATALDGIEHSILTEIDNYRRNAVERMTRSLEAYTARLESFDFGQAHIEIVSAINAAKANFKVEVHQGANELHLKRLAVIATTNDVDAFRAEHHLKRQAHLPRSRIMIWGIVVALTAFEVALNAALFAGGMAGGFLEGFAVATALAVLNVVVGFASGLLVVRFVSHRNFLCKLYAVTGLAVDLGLAAVLNLGVARFRSALESADPEAALNAAFNLPFWEMFHRLDEISGFQSYILIGLGILFHLGAMIDGFKFDDSYPFYGKFWRKREDAVRDYAENKEQLIELLTSERDQTIGEMQDASSTLASSRRIAARLIESRIRANQRFEAYLETLERTANLLLTIYRDSNRTSRTDRSPPQHFDAAWTLPAKQALDSSNATVIDDDVVRKTQANLEAGIIEVNEKYVEAVTEYQKIETMLEEDISHAKKSAIVAQVSPAA